MSGWDQEYDIEPGGTGDIGVALLIGLIISIVIFAIVGAIDMDDTKTNLPPPASNYQHPEEVP